MKPKPSIPPKPAELPSDVAEPQALVSELREQVACLTRMLFGRRSEKLANDPHQGRLLGAADPAEEPTPEEAPEQDEDSAPRRRRRQRGRRPLPEHLPRPPHEIHPPAEECICPCCGEPKVIFGQDVTEELAVVPAKFFVNR